MTRLDNIDLSLNLTKLRAAAAGFPVEQDDQVYRFILWVDDTDSDGKAIRWVQDIYEFRGRFIAPFNKLRRIWADASSSVSFEGMGVAA